MKHISVNRVTIIHQVGSILPDNKISTLRNGSATYHMFVVILIIGLHYTFIKPVEFRKNGNIYLLVPIQISSIIWIYSTKETIASPKLSHFQKDSIIRHANQYICSAFLHLFFFFCKWLLDFFYTDTFLVQRTFI